MNAIEILKEDHQEALGLLGELELADQGPGAAPPDTEGFDRLSEMLELHMKIEEEFLYPVIEELEEARGLIEESYEEHERVEELLVRISTRAPSRQEFQDLLVQLRDSLEDHIRKEEDELFPKVEETLDREELDVLGSRIEELKRGSQVAAPAVRRR
jgi:iron-sulfur cluster repair protein YtfE (RIC family)